MVSRKKSHDALRQDIYARELAQTISNRTGVSLIDELKKNRGDIYDLFRTSYPSLMREILLDDLHAYIKFVAFAKQEEVRRIIANNAEIEPRDRRMFILTRGFEWYHSYAADLFRYKLRSDTETARSIKFKTPLGRAIIQAEEDNKPYITYCKHSTDYSNPMISQMKVKELDKDGREIYISPDGFPKMDGYENVLGLCIIVDPRSRLVFFGLPRGRLKSSLMAGVHGWYAEKYPEKIQLIQSFNSKKTMEHMKAIRHVLENPFGRDIFNDKHPARKNDSAQWTFSDMTLCGAHRSPVDSSQVIGRSVYQDITGTHPDFIGWDDVETKEAMRGEHTEKLKVHFHEMHTNQLSPGGCMAVTGTLYAEEGVHSGLISRRLCDTASVIAASWQDAGTEGVEDSGRSISRKWPTAYMMNKRATTPAEEFARNHELRNFISRDLNMNPRLLLANQYSKFSETIGTGFDRIVLATDTTKTAGTSRGADFMAGCALGLKRSQEAEESDTVVLLGVYHAKPGTERKGRIYAGFLLRILSMCSKEYSKNPCYATGGFPGTDVDSIFDYIETDGETDLSIETYRKIAASSLIDDDERWLAMDAELDDALPGLSTYSEKHLATIKHPYIPRLLPCSTGRRKKDDRIMAAGEVLKTLALSGKFLTPKRFVFSYACGLTTGGGQHVNQIDELKREMYAWEPGKRGIHDDMLDAMAHAIDLLCPAVYRTKQTEQPAPEQRERHADIIFGKSNQRWSRDGVSDKSTNNGRGIDRFF